MSSFSDYLVHSLIVFGLPRQVCSSIFLRGRRCACCVTGDATVTMMGSAPDTTDAIVWECDHCGLERIDFKTPIADEDARALAALRLVFHTGARDEWLS